MKLEKERQKKIKQVKKDYHLSEGESLMKRNQISISSHIEKHDKVILVIWRHPFQKPTKQKMKLTMLKSRAKSQSMTEHSVLTRKWGHQAPKDSII